MATRGFCTSPFETPGYSPVTTETVRALCVSVRQTDWHVDFLVNVVRIVYICKEMEVLLKTILWVLFGTRTISIHNGYHVRLRQY